MKNLYQKLSDENQQKLMENGKLYPTTTALLLEILNKEYAWGQIKLFDVLALYFIIEPTKPFDLETFTELFEN